MHHLLKQSILISVGLFASISVATAEPGYDLFFKTETQYKDVVVKEVISADTIQLQSEIGGKEELIKLIGLRAPKPPKKKEIERNEYGVVIEEEVSPLTPIEEQAFEFVRELLVNQHIRLEFDSEKNGDKNQTLAYVFLLKDNTFVNAEILRNGFANLSIRPPNMKYAEELREAYKEARAEQRGLQAQ